MQPRNPGRDGSCTDAGPQSHPDCNVSRPGRSGLKIEHRERRDARTITFKGN